jgi:hypothetical protein
VELPVLPILVAVVVLWGHLIPQAPKHLVQAALVS